MNISTLVPKFRIEIRRVGSPKNIPWEIAELAHTDNHVAAKLPHWKNNPDIEHRVVENLPAAPAPVRLQPETQRIPPPPQIIPPAPKPMSPIPLPPPAIVATGPAAVPPIPPQSEISAVAAPSPELPFKVGDRLQDVHVPGHPPLRVTAINPNGRSGFTWECPGNENPADQSGFCPVDAVGNFELWDKKKHGDEPPTAEPKGEADASPSDPSAKTGAAEKSHAKAPRKPRPAKKSLAHKPKPHAGKKPSAPRKR